MKKELNDFNKYLQKIDDYSNYNRAIEILEWIVDNYPHMTREVKWNQPMFMDHGTFIFSLTVFKNHISFAPEKETLDKFSSKLDENKYEQGKMLFKIKNDQEINYKLLKEIIDHNILDKKDIESFWR